MVNNVAFPSFSFEEGLEKLPLPKDETAFVKEGGCASVASPKVDGFFASPIAAGMSFSHSSFFSAGAWNRPPLAGPSAGGPKREPAFGF